MTYSSSSLTKNIQAKKNTTPAGEKHRCLHCHNILLPEQIDFDFCCPGCQVAYEYIHQIGLEDFYQLAKKSTLEKADAQNAELIELFDEKEFQRGFVTVAENGQMTARVQIGGLTCYACIWLIKKALEIKAPLLQIDLSLSDGSAELIYSGTDYKLSELIGFIQKIGYTVKPLRDTNASQNATDLIRIGVNVFCFLNVMMLSLPDYVDAQMSHDRVFWQMFRWISLALTSVVMTYGALPFYRTSWIYLKARRASVDQPIVFALIIVFFSSVYNTLIAQGDVYFDSICIVVTLLLAGRYLQKQMMQKAERMIKGRFDYSLYYVKQRSEEGKKILPLNKLKKNDFFYVVPGDPIALDAIVLKGKGEINYEQITGESDPVLVGPGSRIKGGAVCLSHSLELQADEDGISSFLMSMNSVLGKMLLERGEYTKISDRLSTVFFSGIMVLALIIFVITFQSSPADAISNMVATLLVACPCAFAIAVPLTMSMCTALATKKGVVLKSQKAIETLGRVKRIFFDKTGTLTFGKPEVLKFIIREDELAHNQLKIEEFLNLLAHLDQFTSHHHSEAVAKWARAYNVNAHKEMLTDGEGQSPLLQIVDAKEDFGAGMSINWANNRLRIGKHSYALADKGVKEDEEFNLFMSLNGNLIAQFDLEDKIFPDVPDALSQLRKIVPDLYVISGDHQARTTDFAKKLGFDQEHIFAQFTPIEKIKKVSESIKEDLSAMVGNGFNDSLAIAGASVGIAVAEANAQAKNSAEVCFLRPGISPLLDGIEFSRRALSKIKTSFVFASVYNLVGLSLAAFGKINPAIAALLMPISSITVIVIATKWPKRE